MGYDVTNNTSTIELVKGVELPVGTDLTPITLPDSVPSPELIAPDSITPVGDAVELPDTLPTPELIGMEYVVGSGETIEIPNYIPPDGIVLLETIPIPSQGELTGITKLIDLDDVSTSRDDGDLLVYNETTDRYNHVPLTSLSTDLHFTHNQGVSAQVWDIYHNLGKYPAIQITNMSGTIMFPEIRHIDMNHAQAIFGNATFSGVAYCN